MAQEERMNQYPKILLFGFIVFFIMISSGSAATLLWNTGGGTVDGYTVHYGTNSSNPSNNLDVGNTTQYNIDSLPLSENTQYFFCVSAYNSAGASAPCAPVAYTPADATPPAPPVGLVAE
jgi:hypothetical protein